MIKEGYIKSNKPIVLIILDGWGLSPSWRGNAILMSNPPNMNSYWRAYPHTVLKTTSIDVPIIDSRLSFATISAGRYIPQNREIIDQAIENHSFFRNRVLRECFARARKFKSNIHLIGLVSDGKIYSKLSHLIALLEMAYREKFKDVYIDAILDGIDDRAPAIYSIRKIQNKFIEIGLGKFSSVVGRRYAMDEDQYLIKFFRYLAFGEARQSDSIQKAILANRLEPTLIQNEEGTATIRANDVLIFFNFQSSNLKRFISLLTLPKTSSSIPKNLLVCTITQYSKNLNAKVAFPRSSIKDNLPAILAKYSQKQLRIAEAVKSSHVTTYFNWNKLPFELEEDKILPSIKANQIINSPAMSAPKISREATKAIKQGNYDFILINFANADVLAHSGNIKATSYGILIVDKLLGSIVDANLEKGGTTIITSDHGNAEQIGQNSAFPTNDHTQNPVPFILISKEGKKNLLQGAIVSSFSALSKILSPKNTLADIAPTILELMGLPKSELMTGHSLLRLLS